MNDAIIIFDNRNSITVGSYIGRYRAAQCGMGRVASYILHVANSYL